MVSYFRFHKDVDKYGICLSLSGLSVIISRTIFVAANGIILLSLWPSDVLLCVHRIFLVCSLVNGRLGCFRALAIVNESCTGFNRILNIAAVNIGVHVSSQIVLFRRMSRSGIPGSYNNSLFQFF